MKPVNDWENVKPTGDFETLPIGGYICEIKSAKEKPNKNGGGTHLEIMVDVIDGDYKGFFEREYRAQSGEDKYWRGIIYQNCPNDASDKYEAQKSFFKRFTDSIEDSNSGYHWGWDESTLKGKKCGVVFGDKEKVSKKGTQYIATYADSIVSVDDIKNGKFKIPAIQKAQQGATAATAFSQVPAEDDSELPF